LVEGFSKKYYLYKLVYYEAIESIISAIDREKFLKKKTRDYKINLIENFNPEWRDLYTNII
jgi:putative endonuclease